MKLIRVGRKLGKVGRRLITNAGGAPCCCGQTFCNPVCFSCQTCVLRYPDVPFSTGNPGSPFTYFTPGAAVVGDVYDQLFRVRGCASCTRTTGRVKAWQWDLSSGRRQAFGGSTDPEPVFFASFDNGGDFNICRDPSSRPWLIVQDIRQSGTGSNRPTPYDRRVRFFEGETLFWNGARTSIHNGDHPTIFPNRYSACQFSGISDPNFEANVSFSYTDLLVPGNSIPAGLTPRSARYDCKWVNAAQLGRAALFQSDRREFFMGRSLYNYTMHDLYGEEPFANGPRWGIGLYATILLQEYRLVYDLPSGQRATVTINPRPRNITAPRGQQDFDNPVYMSLSKLRNLHEWGAWVSPKMLYRENINDPSSPTVVTDNTIITDLSNPCTSAIEQQGVGLRITYDFPPTAPDVTLMWPADTDNYLQIDGLSFADGYRFWDGPSTPQRVEFDGWDEPNCGEGLLRRV